MLRAARIAVGDGGAGGKQQWHRDRQATRHQHRHRLPNVTYYVSLCSKGTMGGIYARSAQLIEGPDCIEPVAMVALTKADLQEGEPCFP